MITMTHSTDNPALAINGGTPVRTKGFATSCYVSGNERELLLDCLDSNLWSSFKGAAEGWDIRQCCTMPSAEAATHGPTEIRFLGGQYVRKLEAQFADYFGVPYAVSSNSATSCLVMALGALGLGPGDEVICPPMSFNATATAIVAVGAVPVFCEVKEDTFCLDPADIEHRLTERTKAIMVVHLGGNAADMGAVMDIAKRKGLKVIEDCAQAPGVTHKGRYVGTFGDAGIFSLTETKNITCGEGGVLVTADPQVAFKSRLVRNHGEGVTQEDWTDEELASVVGMNFRLTEFQAAVAIPQFESLEERNQSRRENTAHLFAGLAKHSCLTMPVIEDETDYVSFMVKWKYAPEPDQPDKAWLLKAMAAEGIPIMGGYGRLMHENPMFTHQIGFGTGGFPFKPPYHPGGLQYGPGTLPRSEAIKARFLWFKFINAPNTTKDMDDVIAAFDKILGA